MNEKHDRQGPTDRPLGGNDIESEAVLAELLRLAGQDDCVAMLLNGRRSPRTTLPHPRPWQGRPGRTQAQRTHWRLGVGNPTEAVYAAAGESFDSAVDGVDADGLLCHRHILGNQPVGPQWRI
ncbi:Uncharacterised protein [Mycobacteroides abscessus subsp. massiliense]|nr:Uncharacterised protein [Mycobacteroides abscessus subsp. massiliense]